MWKLQAARLIVLVALVCAVPFMVHAHATPTTYEPAAGSTELEVPASITIRFTERIEMGASSLTVFAPNGTKVNQGKGALVENEDRVFRVPINDAGEGVYTVSWQVVSVDDGHFTKGAYSFLVDREGTEYTGEHGGAIEVVYSSDPLDAVLGFVSLVGESIFLAALLFLIFLLRPLRAEADTIRITQSESLARAYTHVICIGFLLFASSGVIAILRKSIELAYLQETSVWEAAIAYLGSSVGTFAALKVAASLLFILIWVRFRKKLLTPSLHIDLSLGALLFAILAMQSYVSHATASFFLPEISIIVTFIHLAAKEFIVGGLLLLVVSCFLFLSKYPKVFGRIALRFDLYASWALLFAGVSGAYVTWLHLKGFYTVQVTAWGELFVVLLGVTGMLGGFRLLHQLVINPRLHEVPVRMIVPITLALETMLGLCVLFISGYIAITTPPFTVEEFGFTQSVVSGDAQIDFEVHPYEHDMFRITIKDGQSAALIEISSLTVTAFHNEQNIGPNVLSTEKRFAGGYVFSRSELSPAGTWEIDVNASRRGAYDVRGVFTVRYPDDVVQSVTSHETRSFDLFGMSMLSIGVIFLLFSLLLMWFSNRSIKLFEANNIAYEPNVVPKSRFIIGFFLALLFCVGLVGAWFIYLPSEFEKRCHADGFLWVQALPSREHEATAPNALLGCLVHQGHYHFVDEREYMYFIESQDE